jgi:hypothetical protein
MNADKLNRAIAAARRYRDATLADYQAARGCAMLPARDAYLDAQKILDTLEAHRARCVTVKAATVVFTRDAAN